MQMKKIVQVIMVGCSIFALAACTHMGRKNTVSDVNDMNGSSMNGELASARTSGLGDAGGGFDGASGPRGLRTENGKRVYYFDFDRSDIRDEDKPAILAHAERLANNSQKKIMLEGHTDPRGSREYNVALGERRANAVAEMMKSKGVNSHQVHVVSYGAQRLASQGHAEPDYQQDRRVVLDR